MRAYLRRMSRRTAGVLAGGILAAGCQSSAPLSAFDGGSHLTPTFTFESGPVRPIALSADGTRLFVANTSNASLDILAVNDNGVTAIDSVPVGLDPVALAVRSATEVWVVNQISDSVSIVDLSTSPAHVSRTLLVGDEPSDIVFGGPGGSRAFITTAHRGQQRNDPSLAGVPGAGDPQLTIPGIGRADVWVFDAQNLGASAGGTPQAIVTLFGDSPRALAVTPDGATVYAAIYKSGNQTATTSSELSCPGFTSSDAGPGCVIDGVSVPGAVPGPATNYAGLPAPKVSMILKTDTNGVWRDVLGRDWTSATVFTLPDQDVFAIDASALTVKASYSHVGTTIFNLAVNPKSGTIYASNTESRNERRFEGPGTYAGETVQGHLAESRITVLGASSVTPRHLNKHIDYSVLPAPAGVADHSLSMPLQIAVSGDGSTLYVAAFGSSKVGVFPAAALESDSFDPATLSNGYLTVSGGGPGGLALDEKRGRLYVTTRFDDGLSVVDLASKKEIAHLRLVNPEPAIVTNGRPFLYDSLRTSSNGEASCASCHLFGDKDDLAWDLGNPDSDVTVTPVNIRLAAGAPSTINGGGGVNVLHPMKGPMTTQTLRGTVNHGAMHWRGDRVSGFFGTDTSVKPPYDSKLAFKNFIVAFNGLVGLGPQFSSADMQSYADFALAIAMPPNPVRALDNSLSAQQAEGRSFFLGCDGLDSDTGLPAVCPDGGPPAALAVGHLADGVDFTGLGFRCEGCHVLNPAMGFFGTDGQSSFENLPQTAKIPQLRNLYTKVGMFGEPANPSIDNGNNGSTGPQVRGTGFEHDGSIDTLDRFLQGRVFDGADGGAIGFANGEAQRQAVEQYLLAFDSDLPPIVGQQVTLRADNTASAGARVDLLMARARAAFTSKLLGSGATECALTAQVVVSGTARFYRLGANGGFEAGDGSPSLSDASLRALAGTPGQEVTYTCVPYGWAGPSAL